MFLKNIFKLCFLFLIVDPTPLDGAVGRMSNTATQSANAEVITQTVSISTTRLINKTFVEIIVLHVACY